MKQVMEGNIPKTKPCSPTSSEKKKQKPMLVSNKVLKAVKKKYH